MYSPPVNSDYNYNRQTKKWEDKLSGIEGVEVILMWKTHSLLLQIGLSFGPEPLAIFSNATPQCFIFQPLISNLLSGGILPLVCEAIYLAHLIPLNMKLCTGIILPSPYIYIC